MACFWAVVLHQQGKNLLVTVAALCSQRQNGGALAERLALAMPSLSAR